MLDTARITDSPSLLHKWFFARPLVTGIITALLIASIAGIICYQRFLIIRERNRQEVLNVAYAAKNQVQQTLDNCLSAALSLSFAINENGIPENFDSAASAIFKAHGYLDGVELVPDGIVKYIYPLAGNEAAVGFDILNDPPSRGEAIKAIKRKEMFFAGPLKLKAGGVGIVGRLPVFFKDKFWGFSSVVIKKDRFLRYTGLDSGGINGYFFQLSKINPYTGKEDFFIEEKGKGNTSLAASVMVPDGEWKITVKPAKENSILLQVTPLIVFAFLLSILGGWFSFYISRRPRYLEQLVKVKSKELETAEQRNTAIVHALPDMMFILDAQGRFIDYHYPKELLKYKPAEIVIGDSITKVLPQPQAEQALQNILSVLKTGKPLRSFANMKFGDKNYDFENRYVLSGNQEILVIVRDITERMKVYNELKKSDERFSIVTKATNDMIWDWNLLTNEIWWNDNYNKCFGYDNSTVHTIDSWIANIHPEDKQRVRDKIISVTKSGEKFWSDEYRYVKGDGTIMFIYDRGYVSHDESGKAYRMIGSMQDISERIMADIAIKEREEKYRNLFERASDSIVIHDLQGNILDVNFVAADLSGFSKEEFKRMKITDFLFEEELGQLPVTFAKLQAGETTLNRRKVRTKSGVVRMMDLSSKLLPDGNVMAIIRDVTERSEAEKALSNSELRFRVLTGNAPVGIFETNAAGETIYVNDKMTEYSGMGFDELLGTNWVNVIHPHDREEVFEKWKENLAAQKESVAEYRILKKDGNIRWIIAKTIPYLDKHGQLSGYLGTATDITNEKLTLLALKSSEEKYRTLVEQASDAIFIMNEAGRFITVNKSACKLSQYSEDELMQMSVHDFTVPADIEKNPLRFDLLKQGKAVISERKMKRKSGDELDVEVSATMLEDGRLLIFIRDITERIRVQNEIMREKNLSDTIINNLPGSFFMYDEDMRLVRRNNNFETISGYTKEEITEMNPLDFFDVCDREPVKKAIQEVFENGKAAIEASYLTKDKRKIPHYFNGWRVMIDGKPWMIGLAIDITEKKKAEELLIKSFDEIRNLASHLTHIREEERKRIGREIHDELGQRLTAVKMDVAWIDKKIPGEVTEIKAKLNNIISLLDGGNKSVRKILSELSPGIIDNHGLVEALKRLNSEFTATTGVQIEFYSNPASIELEQGIANCIYRVYQEALTNIMRYAEAARVTTSLTVNSGKIYVTIEDNGNGFDQLKQKKGKVFGILGMKERVLSQKGVFEIQSKQGEGTCISVTLPYKQ